jgi:hypothetical protein
MRLLAIIVVLACACGKDEKKPDAGNNQQMDAPKQIDAPASDAPAGTPDCATYCTKVMAACTGAVNAQYANAANCMDSCANFTVGTSADQQGNTLGCRINHADLAVGDPATHCVHAGPGGGGACGTPCLGFCSIVVAECPTQWNMGSCMNQTTGCPSFATTPPYKAPSTGNTLECRLYHATMAATGPATHCPHTLAVSTTCQ